jgi:hypothetical protein
MTTAVADAGYSGASSASGYAGMATSLASSVGSILESMQLGKAVYDQSYNQNLEAYTRKYQIAQQNNNNNRVAGHNLQQLALAQAAIVNNANLAQIGADKAGLFKSQAGGDGVLSVQKNTGGTLTLLQAGMQLQTNKAHRQAELMKLAQGFQLPLVGTRYRSPSTLPGMINAITGLVNSGQAAYNFYQSQPQPASPDYGFNAENPIT